MTLEDRLEEAENLAAAWEEAFWDMAEDADQNHINRCLHHVGLPLLEE